MGVADPHQRVNHRRKASRAASRRLLDGACRKRVAATGATASRRKEGLMVHAAPHLPTSYIRSAIAYDFGAASKLGAWSMRCLYASPSACKTSRTASQSTIAITFRRATRNTSTAAGSAAAMNSASCRSPCSCTASGTPMSTDTQSPFRAKLTKPGPDSPNFAREPSTRRMKDSSGNGKSTRLKLTHSSLSPEPSPQISPKAAGKIAWRRISASNAVISSTRRSSRMFGSAS